ncbi:sensor histidine kinase [Alkalibaculum sporogenes]|nr:GHKL domain-containing protein [Alkalibaculum sporogenes]
MILLITVLVLSMYVRLDSIPSGLDVLIYLFILSFTAVCILSVSIYEGILSESEKQMKANLLIQQKEKEYKYNQEIAATVDSIRAIKHDISNHLSVISGYIQCNKYDDAKKYIHKLYKPIEIMNDLLDIEHPVISSMLYVKSMLAEKDNIKLDIDLRLNTEIKIKDTDLTILLGNILDNAIEACNSVDIQNRKISLKIYTVKSYFLVDCINTMNPQKVKYNKKEFYTTKEDTLNHGIGLKNIKIVVDNYEGDMKIQLSDREFSIKTTMINK